jgi:oxygen-independent coproporphyrinogen III oxidase
MGAMDAPFGLYVHVPYCRRICPYCDFNVHIAKRADWPRYGEAVAAEIAARAGAFGGETLHSVYFGGGTPSLAPPATLAQIMEGARRAWLLADGAEVTVEVDPKTLGADGFAALSSLGANRLSLGWQSTHDDLLRRLGRGHTAADSRQAFAWARRAGFDNVSIDLIFAVPGEEMRHLEADLEVVVALEPEHVSLYALTFHEGTTFHRWRERGKLVAVDEELEAAMMERIEERLAAAGYEHYEVSNYAKPGRRSTHNLLYWTGAPYLGVGPGAHSFWRNGWQEGWRWESVRDPEAHARAWLGAAGPAASAPGLPKGNDAAVSLWEHLDARQLLSERFLLGMRLADGVDLAALEVGDAAPQVVAAAGRAQARGWLRREGTRLVPTHAGLMNADALAELFF